MVSIIPCKCPNCNAEIHLDANREFGFCSYCGTKLYIHDDTVTTHYEIHRIIDDAAIMRAESKNQIENRKLDQAEKKSKLKIKLAIAYIMACIVLSILAYIFLQYIPGASGTIILLLAMLLISLPIVLFISHLILKYGETVVTTDSQSSWFGFKKESHDHVQSPTMFVLILFGVYIFIILAVFFEAYKSKTGYMPYQMRTTSGQPSSSKVEVSDEVVIPPSVMENIYDNVKGNTVINAEDIGRTFVYFYDGWNYYTATVLSDDSIQIKNFHRIRRDEKEKFKYNQDVSIIKTANIINCFSWLNDDHNAFIVKMRDTSNYWNEEVLVPFSRIDEKSKAWKKNYATEGISYSYQYDKWNTYQAILLSDDLLKIENWYRSYADDKTPFLHNHDVVVLRIGDSNNDFEWLNDEKTTFSITLKDVNNSGWEEDKLTCFTISEQDENKGFLNIFGG